MNGQVVQRRDGVYEERFDAAWTAEYAEDPENGLWTVEVFRHDVPEWRRPAIRPSTIADGGRWHTTTGNEVCEYRFAD